MNDIQNLPARLDQARTALIQARTDFGRIKIRDAAKAVQVAAEILERKDIQVQASILVSDAERAIAQANPPKPAIPPPGGKKTAPAAGHTDGTEDQQTARQLGRLIQDVRQAHSGISDERFEALRNEAIGSGQPMTRKALLAESRKARREEESSTKKRYPKGKEEPSPNVQPTIEQHLRKRNSELEKENKDLNAAINSGTDDAAQQARTVKALHEQIRVLKIQVQSWQAKHDAMRQKYETAKAKVKTLEGK